MRLLVRANSHRVVEDGITEIAASPDTPRRELWQWHVRVLEAGNAPAPGDGQGNRTSAALTRGSGSQSLVEVSVDPVAADPAVEVIELHDPREVTRDLQEVVVIVVGRGHVRVEGRHVLGEMDALVLEGDDPFTVSLEQVTDEATSLAIARLHGAGNRAIGWVP